MALPQRQLRLLVLHAGELLPRRGPSPLLLLSDLPGTDFSARQAQRASDIQGSALPGVKSPAFPGLCGARFSSKVFEKVDAGQASSSHPLKKLVTVYSR